MNCESRADSRRFVLITSRGCKNNSHGERTIPQATVTMEMTMKTMKSNHRNPKNLGKEKRMSCEKIGPILSLTVRVTYGPMATGRWTGCVQ